MSMNINLTPEQEAIVRGEIETGHFKTAEEVVAKALQSFVEKEHATASLRVPEQREAVLEMLDFVEKNRVLLEGISVKELIHEGHRL